MNRVYILTTPTLLAIWAFVWLLATLLSKGRQPAAYHHPQSQPSGSCEFHRADILDRLLVLDVSPSMLEDDWPPTRLKAAQEAAKSYCQRIANQQPHARIGIIVYGEHAEIAMPLTPANQYDQFAGVIDSIETIDCTDISEGLQMALEIISRPTQIVLMTDGHQNCGSAIPVAEKLKQHSIIECIGIGGSPQDVDEVLLREIATENSDGTRRYRWIGDKQRLIQHFQQLAGRISRS